MKLYLIIPVAVLNCLTTPLDKMEIHKHVAPNKALSAKTEKCAIHDHMSTDSEGNWGIQNGI